MVELGVREDLAAFDPLLDRVRDAVLALPRGEGARGIIHGDLHVGNVLYDPADGFKLIDFGHCAIGWRVYDLVPLLMTLEINVPDPGVVERVRRLVLEGYSRDGRLSDVERGAIPALGVLWHLWDMGESLALSHVFGGPLATGPDATPEGVVRDAIEGLRAALERFGSGETPVRFP